MTEGIPALPVIYPILMSHEPVDLLILMLGTNDTKDRFGLNPAEIAAGIARLIAKAKTVPCWGDKNPNILVVCPPHIGEKMAGNPICEIMGKSDFDAGSVDEGVRGWYQRDGVHTQYYGKVVRVLVSGQ